MSLQSQCPRCAGAFDMKLIGELKDKVLHCPYCGHKIDVPDEYEVKRVEETQTPWGTRRVETTHRRKDLTNHEAEASKDRISEKIDSVFAEASGQNPQASAKSNAIAAAVKKVAARQMQVSELRKMIEDMAKDAPGESPGITITPVGKSQTGFRVDVRAGRAMSGRVSFSLGDSGLEALRGDLPPEVARLFDEMGGQTGGKSEERVVTVSSVDTQAFSTDDREAKRPFRNAPTAKTSNATIVAILIGITVVLLIVVLLLFTSQ